ncbi:MAG: hypothetical protein ACRDIV_25215 [Ktedonobacteraceae bacterium]
MKSIRTKQFHKLFEQLPVHVQKQAREAYQLFKQNPYHPGLHFKRIDPQAPIYSVRISLGYRAVGRYEGDTIIWFWIGSHADYDRL